MQDAHKFLRYNYSVDDFEKDYFGRIGKLASDFDSKRRELAKSRIKMFAASVTRQILDEKMEFDLIIGGGNSGLYMARITEFVYETLGIKTPKVINVPLARIIEEGKETKVLKDSADKLKNIGNAENVLFVDDEIMRAVTAKTCLEMLLAANPKIKHINATIIAENHFFEWHYRMPEISISFFAYSRLIQGLNANISYFIPTDLFAKIKEVLPDVQTHNHAMAAVMGGAIKRINNKPYFDFNVESELKKINDYKGIKGSLVTELKNLVSEGIEEYKNGKIKFRF